MKWLNSNKMRLVVIVFVAAIVLGGGSAKADFAFGEPTNLGPTVNTGAEDIDSSISSDGLSLYFNSNRPGGYGRWDIWFTTRDTIDDEWGAAMNIGLPVNSSSVEASPTISADNLSLFFLSDRAGGYGGWDIWVVTRATVSDPWSEPVNLGSTINSVYGETPGNMPSDGLEFYFNSSRPGGSGAEDLWVTMRGTTSEPWGTPQRLGPTINSSANDRCPEISSDGLMLFFDSDRPGGLGANDLYMTRRATVSDPWGEPVNLGPPVNSSRGDELPSISADGSTLYFSSSSVGRAGGQGNYDLWQVPIIPIVDFNGDEIVDIDDLVIMIENWRTDDSTCDIGPMPWGDGVVDREDVEVLMSYWGQEFKYLPFDLLAYWKLDETEGNIASDSIGGNDGTLNGNPLWQPDGGMVNGAIELDGIDDYISMPLILNTTPGPFSIFAWVKGGMPGQVIFSQKGRSNWLLADPSDGNLMTELRFLVKPDRPLQSQTVITDGDWHRVGLVWDGYNRILYVDDVEVASDTYDKGMLLGDLQIGAGKNLEAGSFWTGLIDDVRIYNRAVTP